MASYHTKLVLRPILVLRSSCYPKSKVTHWTVCTYCACFTLCRFRFWIFWHQSLPKS